MAIPTKQQKAFIALFERYVNIKTKTIFDREFREDITTLRAQENIEKPLITVVDELDNFDEEPSALTKFMLRYKFPLAMEKFIYKFIIDNNIDTSLLELGIYIVDSEEMEASGDSDNLRYNFQRYVENMGYTTNLELTISIPVDATNLQIREAIKTSNEFIRHRQKALGGSGKKTYSRYSAQQHKRILELSKEYNSKDIAGKIGLEYPYFKPTDAYVRKVISQEKKRR